MKFALRPSRVLKKLHAGEVAYVFKLNLSDTRAGEIAARYGFDCLWTDMEHVPTDWSSIEKSVLATKAYDVDLVCRVARGSYSDYIRPLEADATGIMIPHVMNADEAREIVRFTRFHPIGQRPLDGGNADGFYCNIPVRDYMEQANRERFVILQIEDTQAVEELDAIADQEGIDMLLFGAGDYSQAIGKPGEFDHPEVVKVRKKVAATARKYHKYAGVLGGPAMHPELIDMGYSFIVVGADVVGLSQYCAKIAEACGIHTSNGTIRNRSTYRRQAP